MLPSSYSPRTKDIGSRLAGFVSLVVSVALQIQTFPDISSSETLAYSVNHFLLYAAFFGQIVLQIYWLLRVPLAQASLVDDPESLTEDSEPLLDSSAETSSSRVAEQRDRIRGLSSYAPCYVLGNVCLSIWAVAYYHAYSSLAQTVLLIPITFYLFIALRALKPGYQDEPDTTVPQTTLLILKVFMGTCVLYLWRTWGVIDITVSPTFLQQIHSSVLFILLTIVSGPDPVVGLIFIYVLLALFLGSHQNSGWHIFFIVQSGIQAALLVVDSVLSKSCERLNMDVSSSSVVARLPTLVRNDEESLSLLALPPIEDHSESTITCGG